MLMMMMLNYVNHMPIISQKDSYFIPSNYVTFGGGGDQYVYIYIYIYIYWYNLFGMLSCYYVLLLPCRNMYVYVMSGAIYYVPYGTGRRRRREQYNY